MREIVFDTETTGLDPLAGDRVIEIACVELFNLMPTGREFHAYFNPDRDIPEASIAIHGLTASFLADKPKFEERIDDLLAFFGDAQLVAHNAEFDMRFLHAEFKAARRPKLEPKVIDTLVLARRKFPGSPASLDALCRRFAIDNSARNKHGALLDAELLAEVYLQLIGGREPGLALATDRVVEQTPAAPASRPVRPPRIFAATAEELAAHRDFLLSLSNPLWLRD